MRHSDVRTTLNLYGDAFTTDMRHAQSIVPIPVALRFQNVQLFTVKAIFVPCVAIFLQQGKNVGSITLFVLSIDLCKQFENAQHGNTNYRNN
jgi:hypothetical protein